MELHQILTIQYEQHNSNDLTFTKIEKITKDQLYKIFLAQKTIQMYPDRRANKSWNHDLDKPDSRTKLNSKSIKVINETAVKICNETVYKITKKETCR